MKKLIFSLLAMFAVLPAVAQTGLDTLYYDKNWRNISTPAFASYYRVVSNTTDTMSSKPYRCYYFTGELQGEGGYISIDRNDDKNSVFDGDYETFYKSGKTAEKGSWDRGKREGEFTTYNEDGLIIRHLYYSNGELDGVCTEFNEDGTTCVQTEYRNGRPLYDYYVLSNSAGQCSKVSMSTGKPIYEDPAPSDLTVDYVENKQWTFCYKNGIEVATAFGIYGVDIYLTITNNSMFPIDIHEEDLRVSFVDAKSGEVKSVDVWSFARYSQFVERNAKWDSALNAFVENRAASQAGRSSSQTTTLSSGRTGSGKSFSTATTSATNSYDGTAAYQARITASDRISSYNETLNSQVKISESGYLKNRTIKSGETVATHVVTLGRKRAGIYTVNFTINGVTYSSKWNIIFKKGHRIIPVVE